MKGGPVRAAVKYLTRATVRLPRTVSVNAQDAPARPSPMHTGRITGRLSGIIERGIIWEKIRLKKHVDIRTGMRIG